MALLLEWDRRQQAALAVIDKVRAMAHPAQRQFLDHPSRKKAAICSRRAGKSFAAGLALIERALQFPYTKHLYLALTRESAKRILWNDVLKTIVRKLKLEVRFNETELAVWFPNGSVIYLLGADAKSEEQEKLLGQKYKTIVIDEAASYRIDLRRLVYKILEPATVDELGTIIMIGTPGDFIGPPGEDRHMFYSVTSGARRGEASEDNEECGEPHKIRWASFKWTAFDNPHMAENWGEHLRGKLESNPLFEETAEYKTEYLGEWYVDSKNLVYRFNEDRNLIDDEKIPDCQHFIVGIDLGFSDATAFHVWGWRPHDGHLYGFESAKDPGLDLDQVSKRIDALKAKYPKARLIVDGAAKQAVEHLRRVYHQPLHAAEKAGKVDFIAHYNTDLVTARIKLARRACAALVAEYAGLLWDDKSTTRREKGECQNHCADAALYGWRSSLHFTAKPPEPKKPSRWSEEAVLEWEARQDEEDDD